MHASRLIFYFFFGFFTLLSGRSFRSPREAGFGVGWALAVEIWYLLFFLGVGWRVLGGGGGYGTCNNGVCAVLGWCIRGSFIYAFIFGSGFILCFISVSSLFPFLPPTIQPDCDCL
jgi:hypothetical protein